MRRTVLNYVLVFSLALNGATAVTLLILWWKGQAVAVEASAGRKPMRAFLEQDLGLSQDQLRTILEPIDQDMPRVAEIRHRMQSSRSEMIRLVSSWPLDRGAVEAKLKEIDAIHADLRSSNVAHIMNVIQSLPPDARSTFRTYLEQRCRLCDACRPGMEKGPFEGGKINR